MTDTLTTMSNLPAVAGTSLAITGDYKSDLEVGAKIRDAAESLQWMLGDWVNEMEAKHGASQNSLASDITTATGVGQSTLREYARVAKAFPVADRSATSSYARHLRASVADNPVAVLKQAEEQELSARDTARLAKGLPLGGEETAQKESSVVVAGASMEEAVLASIALAEEHLTRALATMQKPGFRLTAAVGQDLMSRLQAASKPFIAIEAAVRDEVGAYV